MPGMEAALYQRQQLNLKLSPQLLMSVKLMELPLADLKAKIEEELEKNPALELIKDTSNFSINNLKKEDAFSNQKEKNVFSGTGSFKKESGNFIEDAISRKETLQEHLLWQLRLEKLTENERKAGELIIQNLQQDGFHIEALDLLLKDFDKHTIKNALSAVRSLDPQGCGTKDYSESLLVQAELKFGVKTKNDIEAILPSLSQLEKGKFQVVAAKTGKSASYLNALFEKLKTLSPFPGRQFSAPSGNISLTRYIVPDATVVQKDGEFKIIINNEEIPILRVSPSFLKCAEKIKSRSNQNSPTDKAESAFIKENLQEARWFIDSLNRRNRTIFRVLRAIVYFQKEFFKRGPKYLAPLTLREIAQKLKMHETTVSRAANAKYVDTAWGIFEIKQFFTNPVGGMGEEGQTFSKGAVKELIKEIITGEKGAQSDSKIAALLEKQGVKIARRTVTKYRNELLLNDSYSR